jgi:hypothetical protein
MPINRAQSRKKATEEAKALKLRTELQQELSEQQRREAWLEHYLLQAETHALLAGGNRRKAKALIETVKEGTA